MVKPTSLPDLVDRDVIQVCWLLLCGSQVLCSSLVKPFMAFGCEPHHGDGMHETAVYARPPKRGSLCHVKGVVAIEQLPDVLIFKLS